MIDRLPTQTTDEPTDPARQPAQELDAPRPEHEPLLPQSDRIVVYGSRVSGAADLAAHIQGALINNGVPEDEARIDYMRDVAYIRAAFFADYPQRTPEQIAPPQHPALETPQTASRSLAQRIRQLFQKPATADQAPSSDVAIPETSEPETDPYRNTRPRGVLIFPEMRQYAGSMGMTIPTNTEVITKLCEENDVPWVLVEKIENEDGTDIEQAVATLLDKSSIRATEDRSNDYLSSKERSIRERVLADFDGESPDAIFPLSGSITQRKDGRWESVGSSDLSEHGLVTIGRARIIAGAQIAKLLPEVSVVANSYNRFDPDEPTMASVAHDELVRRGVKEDQIILEEESFSTITQYVEMIKLAVEKQWTKLSLIINEYYVPRATALYEHLDTIVQDDSFQQTLQEFKAMGGKVAFIEADEILGMMSDHFTHHLAEVKQTPAYQKTVEMEAKGLQDLLDGKYRVVLTPEKPRA